MDENNNNNQTPQNEELEEMTIPIIKNLDPKLFLMVVIMIFIIVGIVITMLGKIQKPNQSYDVLPQVSPESTEPAPVVPLDYISTESGSALPDGFPPDLLLEPEIAITEGYTLAYTEVGKKQFTVRHISEKDITEKFNDYEKFFAEKYWIIVNKQQMSDLATISTMKLDEEVNVTLEDMGTTTRVTISIVRK